MSPSVHTPVPPPTPTGVDKTCQNSLPFKNPSPGDSARRAGLKGEILALRTSNRAADRPKTRGIHHISGGGDRITRGEKELSFFSLRKEKVVKSSTLRPRSQGQVLGFSFLFPIKAIIMIFGFFLSSPEGIFIDLREGERKKERPVSCLLYVPQLGVKPATFRCTGQRCNQLSHPARASWSFWRGPVTSQEGRINHESSQGKWASPFSSPTTQDISKGAAAVSLLSTQGQVGADGPSRPAFSSQHPSAVNG